MCTIMSRLRLPVHLEPEPKRRKPVGRELPHVHPMQREGRRAGSKPIAAPVTRRAASSLGEADAVEGADKRVHVLRCDVVDNERQSAVACGMA